MSNYCVGLNPVAWVLTADGFDMTIYIPVTSTKAFGAPVAGGLEPGRADPVMGRRVKVVILGAGIIGEAIVGPCCWLGRSWSG